MSQKTKVSQKVVNRPNILGTEFTLEDGKEEILSEEKNAKEASEARLKAAAIRSRQFGSIAERFANDKHFQRNHIWPGAKEAFPTNKKMWYVDRYFPYADGGPLFVDEPTRLSLETEKDNFELKKEIMKKLGHRYVVIRPGMSEIDVMEVMA